ncbi:MAG: YaeQ family protein [Stagnimonas sp.]|nr:YaeQ family protein [Stagnimonas sp.]
MALKATICKAELNIADMDRGYYADHALTLAQHPSENDERLMLRLLAFVLYAHEYLAFTKGLSDPDEPDIWQKDLTGAIDVWIDLGQPDEKRVMKACGRSSQVVVITYGNAAPIWWENIAPKLERARNLNVRRLVVSGDTPLASFVQKNMKLQCTVQDGQLWLSDGDRSAQIDAVTLR